jgi:hypothetical protein
MITSRGRALNQPTSRVHDSHWAAPSVPPSPDTQRSAQKPKLRIPDYSTL